MPRAPQSSRVRRDLVAFGVVALGTAVLPPATGAPGASDPTATPAPDTGTGDTPLSRAISLRASFGLRDDPTFVSQTLRTPGLPASPLGIPLTQAEADDMVRRDEAGRQLPALDTAMLRDAPDTYAGSWIDQAAGGVVVVATTTRDTNQVAASAQQRFSPATRVRATTVTHSLGELRRVYTRLEADLPAVTGELGVASIALQPQDNEVQVQLQPDAPADAERSARSRYGTTIAVTRLPVQLGPSAAFVQPLAVSRR